MSFIRDTDRQTKIIKTLDAITIQELMGCYFESKPFNFTSRGLARIVLGDEPNETSLKSIRRTLNAMVKKGTILKSRIQSRNQSSNTLPKYIDAWCTEKSEYIRGFCFIFSHLLKLKKQKVSPKIPAIYHGKDGLVSIEYLRYPLLNFLERKGFDLPEWAIQPKEKKEESSEDFMANYLSKKLGISKKEARKMHQEHKENK
jgi:hypothetical protein